MADKKNTETVKPVKDEKVTKAKKDKKPKEKKLGKKTREISSELKKVTWPSFKEVAKKTGVVLAVVLIFAVVIFGIDTLLSVLHQLLTGDPVSIFK